MHIEEKIKRVVYEQRCKPEETDMIDIEEGRNIVDTTNKSFSQKR